MLTIRKVHIVCVSIVEKPGAIIEITAAKMTKKGSTLKIANLKDIIKSSV